MSMRSPQQYSFSMRLLASVRNVARTAAVAALVLGAACSRNGGQPVRVIIPPGASMRVAAESLSKAGVIRSPRMFRFYAMVRGKDREIKAGTYQLRRGSKWGAVLEDLRAGKGIVYVVTIPEGFSLSQIVPLVSSKLSVPVDSVDAAVRDTALLHQLDIPTPTLEGYLYPDTYIFSPGTTARGAVNMMVRRFQAIWKPEWTARLDTIKMSRNEVITLASIVEKEAKVAQERPVIAAVYLNRLKHGALLQADPTVQYALGKHVARVYYKDLEAESPYNTYKHKGLPPGPIASPGKPSIEAALYPANVSYEYFVAFPDGHHEFRVDLNAHEKARLEARKAWDSVDATHRGDPTRAK